MKSFLIGMMLLPVLAFGQDACPSPVSLNDILECLKEKHQFVRLKELEVSSSKNLENVMGQRSNPVLDVQTVHGRGARQTQIILAQELDLGGRLDALRSKGTLLHQIKKTELAITREEVVEEVLLNIHHLIHLGETLRVNREVHSSLANVLKTLRRRPALNPEQEASLLNFKLQQAEVSNIISLLVDEEEEILLFFLLNGQYQKDVVLKVMEGHHHPLEIDKSSENLSLNLSRLGLETKIASKDLDVQKSVPWNGISVGPMFMDDRLEQFSEKLYGVAFTMPIPAWQTNRAGKELAALTLTNTQVQFSLLKRKEELQKGSLLGRIDRMKDSLSDLPGSDELLKTHHRIEKLYSRGLISPASFLDSHRIWRDVISSKLELEEKILKLSIDYYRLSGKLNEVHL